MSGAKRKRAKERKQLASENDSLPLPPAYCHPRSPGVGRENGKTQKSNISVQAQSTYQHDTRDPKTTTTTKHLFS